MGIALLLSVMFGLGVAAHLFFGWWAVGVGAVVVTVLGVVYYQGRKKKVAAGH